MSRAVQGQFHKDDIVTVTIEDLGASGEGIGHADGFTLFIKDALPGDTVRAKIVKVKKGYGFARLMEIAEPSPFRVDAQCPAARPCGGCQVQELAYERQLEFKFRKVRENLVRIGGLETSFVDSVLYPVLGMKEPWRFRNKAQYPVGERNGELIAGFYAGRTHHIVPAQDCLIGAPENALIVRTVLDYMKRYHVSAYDEKTGKGLVRHILIRSGYYSGQIMVCLVINGTKLPEEDRLVCALRETASMSSTGHGAGGAPEWKEDRNTGSMKLFVDEAAPKAATEIVSISLNINTEKTNVIMGPQVRVLWGKDAILDSLQVMDVLPGRDPGNDEAAEGKSGDTDSPAGQDGILSAAAHTGRGTPVQFLSTGRSVTFRISPLSFYQVNPRQTEKLYSLVRYFAGLTGNEVVWDLYCGVGTISCFLAQDAKEVYGVEVIPDAIRDARENARINGLTNVVFEVGRVEEVLPAYVRRVKEERRAGGGDIVDVVVVDPPRKGCDPLCLQTILNVAPRRIVYVSCDPATLARDLRILTGGGYEIRAVQPVDMFPHSVHVETVVSLFQP